MTEGQIPDRFDISNITNTFPCTVFTSIDNDFVTFEFVRLTGLDGCMPIPRGMDQINNKRFRIIVTGTNSFNLQDPITFEYVDATNFTPYVIGGSVNRVPDNFFYYPGTPVIDASDGYMPDEILPYQPQ